VQREQDCTSILLPELDARGRYGSRYQRSRRAGMAIGIDLGTELSGSRAARRPADHDPERVLYEQLRRDERAARERSR
jgi:hypothetical protein